MADSESVRIDVDGLFTPGRVSVFVWTPEPGWPVRFASPSAARLLGRDLGEILSGSFLFADAIHPDDRQDARRDLEAAAEEGRRTHSNSDYRVVRSDGSIAWVDEAVLIERDPSGRVLRYVGYLIDVTARHAAEWALREQGQRLELVLEGTQLGMWDWNPQTGAVTFNERWATMIGYELAEIPPSVESWSSRVHPDDLDPCYRALQDHIDGRVPFYENVHRMRHKDGHWVYILDRGKIVERDAEGRPVRFTGTHTDITAQKTAELEARRASRVKSRFLANMSHEVRTPLNGILGLLNVLENSELDDGQRELVELIRESGEGLLVIINDILDLSRVEAGRMRVDPHPFDVRRVMRSVHDLYHEHARAKGLRFELEIADHVPERVEADGHRIQQIVMNLTSNAIKFTERGHVTLEVDTLPDAQGGTVLTVEVDDSGPGIADTDVIWQPFDQEDASISRKFGGTGLGLSICRELSRLMDGSIEVESTPGIGSRFTLTVPVLTVGDAGGAPKAEPDAETPRFDLDVLVAEDNRINQLVVVRTLERFGVRLTVVDDGRAAVAACDARRFDLVLMDVHMPGLDGIAACRAIRENLGSDAPPIVALTADALGERREDCREAGMVGFIEKPFQPSDIGRILRRVAEGEPPDADASDDAVA